MSDRRMSDQQWTVWIRSDTYDGEWDATTIWAADEDEALRRYVDDIGHCLEDGERIRVKVGLSPDRDSGWVIVGRGATITGGEWTGSGGPDDFTVRGDG